jgi:hypothetical protein
VEIERKSESGCFSHGNDVQVNMPKKRGRIYTPTNKCKRTVISEHDCSIHERLYKFYRYMPK